MSLHLVSPWKSQSFFSPTLQDQLVINFRWSHWEFCCLSQSTNSHINSYFNFWLLQSKYLPANPLSPFSSAGTHIHLPSAQEGKKLGMLTKYWENCLGGG